MDDSNGNLQNRAWRAERRLDDLERRLDRLEIRVERLERRPMLDPTSKFIIYGLVMVIVALITGTSVNISGLLK